MITFRTHSDLHKLDCNDPAYPVVQKLIELLIDDFPEQPYNADDYGYIVLIEKGDTERALDEIEMPCLKDIPWEGVSMRHGFIYAVYLGTDDYGIGFLIPDAPWINGELRKVLEEITD